VEEIDWDQSSKHSNSLEQENDQRLSGIPEQILDGKERDNGRLRQYEQAPQMRCCSFIRLARDPDEGNLPEHNSERSQRHSNRQGCAGLPEGGSGTSHLTSSLLLEEYRSLARLIAPIRPRPMQSASRLSQRVAIGRLWRHVRWFTAPLWRST
jgi:hypothetical protein